MQAGKYLFVITLECCVVGSDPIAHSSIGLITVKDESATDSQIESDITRVCSLQAKQNLAKDGYIMIDDEIKTLSFSLNPQ